LTGAIIAGPSVDTGDDINITTNFGGSIPINTVLAGPGSGSAAAPSFRALTLADLPKGSTSGQVLTAQGSGTAPIWAAPSGGGNSPVWYGTTTADVSAHSISATGLNIVTGSVIGILFSTIQGTSSTSMTLALTGTNDTAAKGLFYNGTQLTRTTIKNYISNTQVTLWQYNGTRWNLLNPIGSVADLSNQGTPNFGQSAANGSAATLRPRA